MSIREFLHDDSRFAIESYTIKPAKDCANVVELTCVDIARWTFEFTRHGAITVIFDNNKKKTFFEQKAFDAKELEYLHTDDDGCMHKLIIIPDPPRWQR